MMLGGLRYHFVEKDHKLFIEDATDLAHPPCVYSYSAVNHTTLTDCAILARFYSPLTASTVVVVAGAGRNGTEAASRLITSPEFSNHLAKELPRNWQHKNIEILLKVTAIDAGTSAPTILTIHTWDFGSRNRR